MDRGFCELTEKLIVKIYQKTNKGRIHKRVIHFINAVDAYQIIMDDVELDELYISVHTDDEIEANLVQVDVPGNNIIIRKDDIN